MNEIAPKAVSAYPLNSFLFLVRETGNELVRNVQAPDALIGMALINVISMACQGLIDVKLPTGQVRPVSQNLLLVAESGERKSTVSSLLLAPFREYDMQALANHKRLIEQYQVELGLWEAKAKGMRSAISMATKKGKPTTGMDSQLLEHAQGKPKKPRLRTFLRQDITAKAIMEALQGDGESIAITTDEGNMLFRGEAMTHLGLLNRLWDSPEVLPLDRADNEQLLALNPRVSMSIMTQHAPLRAFLEKRGPLVKGSGHWARYLVGWPHSTIGHRRVDTEEQVWEQLTAFQARTRTLLDKYQTMIESESIERELVGFTIDAKARWIQLATRTEEMLCHGGYLSDISDFASKMMEITARLAAAMHYFGGEGGDISLDTLERAFAIVVWHVEEYKNLFSPQSLTRQEDEDARQLTQYLRERVWKGPGMNSFILKNHLLRNGPLRNRIRLNAALDLLRQRAALWIGQYSPPDKRLYVCLNDSHFMREMY